MYISKNINYLIKSTNIDQNELARLLGLTASAVSNYVKGVRKVDADKLKMMSEIFNVSMDDMISVDLEAVTRETRQKAKELKAEDYQESYGTNLYDIRNLVKKVEELEASAHEIDTAIERPGSAGEY